MWNGIETAPLDGTLVDLWVTDSNGDGYRVVDCVWDDFHGWECCERALNPDEIALAWRLPPPPYEP